MKLTAHNGDTKMIQTYFFTKSVLFYGRLFVFLLIWDANGQETGYDSPDNWQFGSDNYSVCARLKYASALTRYADGTPVTEEGYMVTNAHTSGECGYGWIRLDHREIVWVLDASGTVVQRLVWHKGGQGYDVRKPAYGWIDIEDIDEFDGTLDEPYVDNVPHRRGTPQPDTKGMAPIGEPLVPEGTPLENGVPFWDGTSWNSSSFLGKGSPADENVMYNYKVVPTSDSDGIPITWQYKQDRMYSRYNKYADGGSDFGDETAQYAWLMWSFLTTSDGETNVGGGGMMRGLVKNGQEFYRCEVASVNAKSWGYNSSEQVGEITAWYIKTRGNSYSPWMYGWVIAEHRVKNEDGSFGPSIRHYTAKPTKYEAEFAAISSGVIDTDASGVFVNLQNNGEVIWEVPVSRPETYLLNFNIAKSNPDNTDNLDVYLDGDKIGEVGSTSSAFSEQSVAVTIPYGTREIKLKNAKGATDFYVDYFSIISEFNDANLTSGSAQKGDFEKATVLAYPNPVQQGNILKIEFENAHLLPGTIEVYDMKGILIFSNVLKSTENTVSLVDINWEPSLYNLVFKSEKTVISKKILVID